MRIKFNNKNLQDLYTKGKSKKYSLSMDVVKKFVKVMAILEAAYDIYDLWSFTSLHFEKLKGYKNRFSARISQKWRLEMEINWENEEKKIGIINVIDISKHYGG